MLTLTQVNKPNPSRSSKPPTRTRGKSPTEGYLKTAGGGGGGASQKNTTHNQMFLFFWGYPFLLVLKGHQRETPVFWEVSLKKGLVPSVESIRTSGRVSPC